MAVILGVMIGTIVEMTTWLLEDDNELVPVGRSWTEIIQSDTLRIATSPECASLFVHNQHWMGHDFEITSSLVHHLDLHLDFYLADSVAPLFASLYEGETDVLLLSARQPQELPEWAVVANEYDAVQWIVLQSSDTLSVKIDSVCQNCSFFATHVRPDSIRNLARKARRLILREDGSLSPFDGIFKAYSRKIGWDWRLLASVSFAESRFNNECVSPRGARGVMQLMPTTAAFHGCTEEGLSIPDSCILAGVSLIGSLENSLRSRIARTRKYGGAKYINLTEEQQTEIEQDLLNFTLASYNAGLGHIFDAIALADTLGYDPSVWKNNVEHCLRLKNDPLYSNLPCVRCGKFNSSTTRSYVQKVLETYEDFCQMVRLN